MSALREAAPAASDPAAAIVLHDLTLGYGGRPAVHHLDGTVRDGDLLALVGPNGAGKSTLLKGLVGEVAVAGGSIGFGTASRRHIAYLPQRAEIDLGFPISVHDIVATGLWRRVGGWRGIGRADRLRIEDALGEVGLHGLEGRPIGTLSGGQVQRAFFARTILQEARTVLLDEPFAAIDARTTADLMAIVRRWHEEGRTVVAAMHDLYQVRASFPRTLLLAREAVAWGATLAVLTKDNLARARQQVEAWDASEEAWAGAATAGAHA